MIWLVDGFYRDFKLARELALSQNFSKHRSGIHFGNNGAGVYIPPELLLKVPKVIQSDFHISFHKTKKFDPGSNGRFRAAYEWNNVTDTDIHHDYATAFSVVVYLNTASQCKGRIGTVFYKHVLTGAIEAEPRLACSDRDAWKPWRKIMMKPNRALIFKSSLYHAVDHTFGRTIEDARLTQIFWLSPGHTDRGINSYRLPRSSGKSKVHHD